MTGNARLSFAAGGRTETGSMCAISRAARRALPLISALSAFVPTGSELILSCLVSSYVSCAAGAGQNI